MNYDHSNLVRILCPYCKRYFDTQQMPSLLGCPLCREYIDKPHKQIVPWWYGMPVPGYIVIKLVNRYMAAIPNFYLDNHIWFMGINGRRIARDEAREYFRERISAKWGEQMELLIIDNMAWETYKTTV